MQYRREIDGLRALAVLPVILFHAGFAPFSGGFVGVDVFFVISGYLITGILLEELRHERFTLAGFYERRARRILPALFVVLAASLAFAWWGLLPRDMAAFSDSLVAVPLFVSNLLFWRTSGYFDPASELKPLLHTWSLAVEEQFYILFPLALLAAWRTGRRRIGLLMGAAALASLALAHWASMSRPTAAFYLLPTRGWELLIGAIAAWHRAGRALAPPDREPAPPGRPAQWRGRLVAESGALAGIALLAGAVLLFDRRTPFPGVHALVPTLGTALVLLCADARTVTGRLLGSTLLVGMGLVSYSAYLWHQPLFAFARLLRLDEPPPWEMAGLALASLLLAGVTWKYVETPFRDRRGVSRRSFAVLSVAGGVLLVTAGIVGSATDGFRQRSRWLVADREFEVMGQRGSGERHCQEHRIDSPLGPLVCVIGAAGRPPEGVLWGDSFAGALMHGLDRVLAQDGRAFYMVSSNGCVPVEGTSRTVYREFGCTEDRHRGLVDQVLRDPSLRTVVWVGAFAQLTAFPDTDYLVDGVPADAANTQASIIATLKKLRAAGRTVVLVGDTPRMPYPAAEFAIRRIVGAARDVHGAVQTLERSRVEQTLNQQALLAQASRFATVVDAVALFCDDGTCASHDAQGRLLFIDRSHLSHRGSERLAEAVAGRLGWHVAHDAGTSPITPAALRSRP